LLFYTVYDSLLPLEHNRTIVFEVTVVVMNVALVVLNKC